MYRPTSPTDTEPRCPVCGGGDIHSFSCARMASPTPPAPSNSAPVPGDYDRAE